MVDGEIDGSIYGTIYEWFLEYECAFGRTLKTNHLSGVDLPPFAFSVCPAAHTIY